MPIVDQSRRSALPTQCAYGSRGRARQRRLSVEIRLALYRAADRAGNSRRRCSTPGARSVRAAQALARCAPRRSIEDRKGANFAGQFESFLGIDRRDRLHHRGARLLGRAVDHQCAPLHGKSRLAPGRYRDGGADPAAGRGPRVGRRPQRERRRQDAAQRHLGARLGDRAGRGGAGSHRADRVRASCAAIPPAASITATPAGTAPARRSAAGPARSLWRRRASTAGKRSTLGRHAAQGRDACSACRSRSNGRSTMQGLKLLQARPLARRAGRRARCRSG